MIEWIAAAVVGGAVLLWPKTAAGADADSGGPPIATSPPVNPATGKVLGSPGDLAHKAQQAVLTEEGLANKRSLDAIGTAGAILGTVATVGGTVATALGLGVSVEAGLTIGGTAIGAAMGVTVGTAVAVGGIIAIAAAFVVINIWSAANPYDKLQFYYSPRQVTDWQLELFGLPYRPDLAPQSPAGGVSVTVPRVPSSGDVQVAETMILPFTGFALGQMFPGVGAVEACRRSGMFAWRPFDIPTPFSQALYSAAPLLLDYERLFIRSDPYDYETADGQTITWAHLAAEQTDEAALGLMVLQMRRLAAWREISLDAADTVAITARMGGFYKTAQERGADHVVTTRRDIGNWLSWHYVPHRYSSPARERIGGPILHACNALDVPVLFRRPQQNSYISDAVSFNQIAWGPHRHRTPAGLGFPGAWRALPHGTAATPAPEFKPDDPYPDPIWLANRMALIATRDRLLAVMDAATAAGQVVDATLLLALNQAQMDLLHYGNQAPMVLDTPPPPLPSDPHPEQAFVFECWLHTGPVRISSRRFLDIYGSHAAVQAALERGEVAWDPTSNSADVRNVWRWFDQTLEAIEPMFATWAPFSPMEPM